MGHLFSKLLKHILCQSLFLLLALITKGQIGINETLIPKSPNAAAFDKIDPIPVQLATGGANISFSLYDLKSNSIEVPIALQYHSGGIQVDEASTWVGLGWALDVGGSITRTIRGNPDEGLYFSKEKHYYLTSSVLGSLNSNAGARYIIPGLIIYDTSANARHTAIQFFNDNGISYGTITVSSLTLNAQYNMALQYNLWGAYNSSYLFNGLNSNPQLYLDIQTANADPQKAGFSTTSKSKNIFTNALVDLEPDEFTIKIPGYSGKFYFNTQGKPTLDPIDRDIKITYTSNRNESDSDVAPYIDTWVVSTTDGRQYYFGVGDSSKTYTNPGYDSRSVFYGSKVIVGWDLNKIVDINTHDSVVFTYKHLLSSTYISNNQYFTGNNAFDTHSMPNPYGPSSLYVHEESIPTQIIAGNTTVNLFSALDIPPAFNTHSNSVIANYIGTLCGPRMDSIVVNAAGSSTSVAKYYFNYGHFQMYPKLKLLSFQKISNNLVDVQPPTTFNYYDTTVALKVFSNIYMPSKKDTVGYTPFAKDYWGYYNNAQQNYMGDLVSPYGSTSREAAWPFMQLGVLNKIIYPEGGQSIIQYEPHAASTFFNEFGQLVTDNTQDNYCPFNIDTIGGLRIKSIQQKDEHGKIVQTLSYAYTNANGNSSGQLNIFPSVTESVEEPLCFVSSDSTNYLLLSTSNRTPSYNNVATVNYARVTETVTDSIGNSNGYTIHNFYDDANITDTSFLTSSSSTANYYLFNGLGNMPYWMSHTSPKTNLLNGLEKETDVYDKAGVLQKKIVNTYSVNQSSQNTGFIGGAFFSPFSLDNICYNLVQQQADYYTNPGVGMTLTVQNGNTVLIHSSGRPKGIVPPTHVYYYVQFYAVYPKFEYLSQRQETSYSSPSNYVTIVHQSFYESPNHYNETRTIDYTSKGDSITTVKLYAFDFAQNINGDTSCKQMQSLYFNPLISSTTFKGNQIQSGSVLLYKNFGTSRSPGLFPASIYLHRSALLNSPVNIFGPSNKVTYPVSAYFADNNYTLEQTETFNTNGNLTDLHKPGTKEETYVWGYNNQYPVAKIIGSNYTSSISLVNQATLNNITTADTAMRTELNKLRTGLPNAVVSTYTYLPDVGTTSETDPLNKATYYQYDGYSRLSVVLDQDKNVLKRVCYNYAGIPSNCSSGLFFNPQQSQTFTSSCPTGYQATTMNYTVAPYTYSSSTIAGAVQLAQNDINMNGQNYANTKGECQKIYYNVADTGTFYNQYCMSGTSASATYYIVPANTFTSLSGQADANTQAQFDITNNGQNYANTNGSCLIVGVNLTASNHNPNGPHNQITVTLQNNSTRKTYTSGTIAAPNSYNFIGLPSGIYTVTFSGPTLLPNTGIGIFLGYSSSGSPVYCTSSSGTTLATISNVELDSGQQYYLSQISSCEAVIPAVQAVQSTKGQ